MPNEDLLKPLKAINQTIARLREDVQTLTGEVKKIHTVVKEAAGTVRDAIQENIQAQAELKLMEHVMDVRSVKPQIVAERDQLSTERDELEARLERIGKRYERKQAELDEKARERIRDLGSHIFEIDEEQFEAGIEEPFTNQVTSTWQLLQAHNDSVREERNDQVQETTEEVVESIQGFVDRQEALVETIRGHRLNADEILLPDDRTERLQVPYYVVEYEVDGVTQRKTVIPSQITTDEGTDWCTVSLSAVPGATELMADLPSVDDTTPTESLSEDVLVEAVEEYGESSVLGASYEDAVADAAPENGRIPVYVAGGEK